MQAQLTSTVIWIKLPTESVPKWVYTITGLRYTFLLYMSNIGCKTWLKKVYWKSFHRAGLSRKMAVALIISPIRWVHILRPCLGIGLLQILKPTQRGASQKSKRWKPSIVVHSINFGPFNCFLLFSTKGFEPRIDAFGYFSCRCSLAKLPSATQTKPILAFLSNTHQTSCPNKLLYIAILHRNLYCQNLH